MRMALIIYLLALLLVSFPIKCLGFDYEVDWPTSGNGKHSLAITINGCETRFTIQDKNLEAFQNKVHNDKKTRQELISAAIKRAENGCK